MKKNELSSFGLPLSQLKKRARKLRRKTLIRKLELETKTWNESEYLKLLIRGLSDVIKELQSGRVSKTAGLSLIGYKHLPHAEIYVDKICRGAWLDVLLDCAKRVGYNWALRRYLKNALILFNLVPLHEVLHHLLEESNHVSDEVTVQKMCNALINWEGKQCSNIITLE